MGAGMLFSSGKQGIPQLLELETLEGLHVRRGELGDAEGAEAEGGAGVVDAAAGESGRGDTLPETGVKFASPGRKADDLPARVLAIALDDPANRGVPLASVALTTANPTASLPRWTCISTSTRISPAI